MGRYTAFVKVVETGSFSRAASELGYTQSAVSQMIQALEQELGSELFQRSRKGVELTPDGREYLPYIRGIYNARQELMEKKREMQGLQSGIVRIGTFSSVSSSWLPPLIRGFKQLYPQVHFDLQQGDYTSISAWIREGSVDFGFLNPDIAKGFTAITLDTDEMLAVFPAGHPFGKQETLTLADLEKEPYILLEEGVLSEPLRIFQENDIHPKIEYRVHDDYTIMSMIENGLGIAILPKLVLQNSRHKIETRRITPPVLRKLSLAYKDKQVLPIASRKFIDYILEHFHAQ